MQNTGEWGSSHVQGFQVCMHGLDVAKRQASMSVIKTVRRTYLAATGNSNREKKGGKKTDRQTHRQSVRKLVHSHGA